MRGKEERREAGLPGQSQGNNEKVRGTEVGAVIQWAPVSNSLLCLTEVTLVGDELAMVRPGLNVYETYRVMYLTSISSHS